MTTAIARPDTSEMIFVHNAFRQQFRALPDLVRAVPAGDTKDDLPSTPASHDTAVAPQASSRATASTDDATNGWRLAAVIEGGLLVAFANGAVVFMTGRQRRAPRMGV